MSFGLLLVALNAVTALAAFVAAALWYRSATVQGPHRDEPDANGIFSAAIIVGENTDFIGTAMAQSLWSKRAAYAAAVAAGAQGLAFLLQAVAT